MSKGQCLKSSAAVPIPAWSLLSLLHANCLNCLGNARDFATDPWSDRHTLDSFCSKFPALRLLSAPAPRAGSYPAIALSYRSATPRATVQPPKHTHALTQPASSSLGACLRALFEAKPREILVVIRHSRLEKLRDPDNSLSRSQEPPAVVQPRLVRSLQFANSQSANGRNNRLIGPTLP